MLLVAVSESSKFFNTLVLYYEDYLPINSLITRKVSRRRWKSCAVGEFKLIKTLKSGLVSRQLFATEPNASKLVLVVGLIAGYTRNLLGIVSFLYRINKV